MYKYEVYDKDLCFFFKIQGVVNTMVLEIYFLTPGQYHKNYSIKFYTEMVHHVIKRELISILFYYTNSVKYLSNFLSVF